VYQVECAIWKKSCVSERRIKGTKKGKKAPIGPREVTGHARRAIGRRGGGGGVGARKMKGTGQPFGGGGVLPLANSAVGGGET